MKQICTQSELDQLHRAGQGIVYNDFSGMGASGREYNVLHAAGCRWLERSNVNVRKFWFADLPEARSWLNTNRGPEGVAWKRCGTCNAEP
jgi:hypothetical protein